MSGEAWRQFEDDSVEPSQSIGESTLVQKRK